MAGQIRYLQKRDGRYYARLVVPRDLSPYVEKTELRTPLGADRRQAIARLPSEVAKLQHRIAVAERKAEMATGNVVEFGRYPLNDSQIAVLNYQERLLLDDALRNYHRYARVGIDDQLVITLREGMAGRLGDIHGRGLFRVIEIVRDRETKAPFDPEQAIHRKVKALAIEAGLICYPLGGTIDGRRGDHILLAPPFIIEDGQIDELVSKLSWAIRQSVAA